MTARRRTSRRSVFWICARATSPWRSRSASRRSSAGNPRDRTMMDARDSVNTTTRLSPRRWTSPSSSPPGADYAPRRRRRRRSEPRRSPRFRPRSPRRRARRCAAWSSARSVRIPGRRVWRRFGVTATTTRCSSRRSTGCWKTTTSPKPFKSACQARLSRCFRTRPETRAPKRSRREKKKTAAHLRRPPPPRRKTTSPSRRRRRPKPSGAPPRARRRSARRTRASSPPSTPSSAKLRSSGGRTKP
mmetsp:Transcript_14029/g.60080  ORF Transcript_14029/g.60080 Transcript_14029/m.60080 type:complete len:245 (+) Transcript_14029:4728-5462(+)